MRAKKKRLTDEVENALYARAIGYTVDEATLSPDEDGEKTVKIVRKHVAPSIQAQILWLRAYRPEIWGKSVAAADADDSAAELFKALDRASIQNGSFNSALDCENAVDSELDDEHNSTFDNSDGETEFLSTEERDGGGSIDLS